MTLRRFALVLGIVFLLVGILGFVPALLHPPEGTHDLAVEAGHGRLLGLFPVNAVHNVVHLLIGAWGILAWRGFAAALGFARGLAVLYGVLAVLGLIPATQTLFGLAPLYGHVVWLHAGTALLAAWFGWGGPSRERPDGPSLAGTPID